MHDSPLPLVDFFFFSFAHTGVHHQPSCSLSLCHEQVQRLYDVGIAGIHRLFSAIDTIRQSHACVAVAGMDGALPTVVAGK